MEIHNVVEKITLQIIFNKAYQRFVVEGAKPSVDAHDTCFYRHPDGVRRCAVGLALEPFDDVIDYDQCNTMGFSNLVKRYPAIFSEEVVIAMREAPDWLDAFQKSIHDHLIESGEWKSDVNLRREYMRAAANYGLVLPEEEMSNGN